MADHEPAIVPRVAREIDRRLGGGELEGALTPMLAGFRAKRSLRVEQKADATLLSEADEDVQAQIIKCIRAADPDGLIIGEEGAHVQMYCTGST